MRDAGQRATGTLEIIRARAISAGDDIRADRDIFRGIEIVVDGIGDDGKMGISRFRGWALPECSKPTCYPDCDGDASLTINDFICFQTSFAIGDPFADCDEGGSLTIDDFICFQTAFAVGC